MPHTISPATRMELVRRLFLDESVELVDRVAGCVVLLYAQPISRVARTKVTDLEQRGQEVWLGLVEEHLPLPEPVAHSR